MADENVTYFGPPRDRRRGRRYFTRRNVLIVVGFVVVVFAAVSLISELRKPAEGEYGRLYDRRTIETDVEPRAPMEVINESSISDQGSADPMLLDGVRREEYLGVTPEMLEQQTSSVYTAPSTPAIPPGSARRPLDEARKNNSSVVITGGPDGVQLKVEPPR